jgi:orotate phosphoribosyltransferase-like protein
MKSSKLFGLAVIALGFTSCKDEKKKRSRKTVDNYVVYVDFRKVTPNDVKMNWQSIEANYDVKMNQAETALADIKENKEASEKSKLAK